MIGANEYVIDDKHGNACTVFADGQRFQQTLAGLRQQGVKLMTTGPQSAKATELRMADVRQAVRGLSAS